MRAKTFGTLSAVVFCLFGACAEEPAQPLIVEFQANPLVSLTAEGKTRVVMNFVVRNADRTPIAPEDTDVTILVGDSVLDAESLPSNDSRALPSNIHLGIVLDASFSMLTHSPPVFHRMLESAGRTIEHVRAMWTDRGGAFTSDLVWFEQWIYHPMEQWTGEQIAAIPEPMPGSATKLLGAVDFMVDRMRAEYNRGVASGTRDQHMLLVFSDGADNYSYFDNRPDRPGGSECDSACVCANEDLRPLCAKSETCFAGDSPYEVVGYQCTDLDMTVEKVESHPSLVVNVLGLGSSLRRTELRAMAEASDGHVIIEERADNIEGLFEEGLKEFTTQHSHVAEVPLSPGVYQFSIELQSSAGNRASCTFAVTTSGAGAEAGRPECS